MIDEPDADTQTDSEGTCKKCHATKRFSNAMASSEWYGYNKTRPWTKDIAKATTRQEAGQQTCEDRHVTIYVTEP
jgi:hypothetical protein